MANEEATLVPELIEGSDYRLNTERVDMTSVPEIAQELEVMGEDVPEITHTIGVGGMIQTPVDATLSIAGMAADAKAVGDRFDATDEDISDLAADLASAEADIDVRLDAVEAKTGSDIAENGDSGAGTIAAALSGIRSDISSLSSDVQDIQAWTGEDIPEKNEPGADTIAEALTDIRTTLSGHGDTIDEIEGWTGEDIPVSDDTGALSIAAAVQAIADDVDDNAQMIEGHGTRLDNIEDALADKVNSVDGVTVGENGNVPLDAVRYDAQELSSTDQETARENIGAASVDYVDSRILTPATAIAIPAAEGSATYNMDGLTGDHVVVMWRFSASPENIPPCALSITTFNGSFTIANESEDVSPSETVRPVFAVPAAVTLTT